MRKHSPCATDALFDAEDYERSDPPWGSGPMPLWMFPADKRERIEHEASQDEPPPRWLKGELAQIASRAWYEWHWRRGSDPDKARERLPTWIRRRVIERDGYVCGLCGEPVVPADVHLDHIVPFSRGGPTTVANLQVTHSRCNMRKGAKA